MRRDMPKIICERPRLYGGGKIKGRASNTPIEDLPTKESMTKKWMRGNNKELNENLRPLERFLHSRIGCKWNDVYSEIRQNLNPNSAIQLHILQHLEHMVLTETWERNGKIYGQYSIGPYELFNNTLYVDEQGILRKYFVAYKKERKHVKIKKREFELHEGTWHEITYIDTIVKIGDRTVYTKRREKRDLTQRELKWLQTYIRKNYG